MQPPLGPTDKKGRKSSSLRQKVNIRDSRPINQMRRRMPCRHGPVLGADSEQNKSGNGLDCC